MSTDVHLTDTYFVVAHFHYVMMGGAITAFFGGVHYWWPKITGRMYNEKTGRWGALLVFIGLNETFFPQFIMGSRGMPRRYYDYIPEFQPFHVASTIGAYILGVGFLMTTVSLLRSLLKKPDAPMNPWGSNTLEWTIPSPRPTTSTRSARDGRSLRVRGLGVRRQDQELCAKGLWGKRMTGDCRGRQRPRTGWRRPRRRARTRRRARGKSVPRPSFRYASAAVRDWKIRNMGLSGHGDSVL
jgi:hypothetical protein